MAVHICPHCRIAAVLSQSGASNDATRPGVLHQLLTCAHCNAVTYSINQGGRETLIHPTARVGPSGDIPQAVAESFDEAIKAANGGIPRAAVIMCRSAIQAATREQGATHETLFSEIDDLAAKHVIPQSLKEWAHEVRSAGNPVAHPDGSEPVTMADANEIVTLAESLFDYLYVIPADIERRRARAMPSVGP